MIVWVDLETSGLAADKEVVLEVAAVITDDALNEVDRFTGVTTGAKHHDLSKVDPYVLAMHVQNGLWCESLMAPEERVYGDTTTDPWQILKEAGRLGLVDTDLSAWIYATIQRHLGFIGNDRNANMKAMQDHIGEKNGPQLAGSTISFDRAFMQAHLPRAHALLSYHNLDVTSLNEMTRRFWPAIYEARPRNGESKHRALDDVLDSLEVARYYAKALGPALPFPVTGISVSPAGVSVETVTP